MVFEKYLVPDLVLSSFRDITPALLENHGIRFILSDIDNTLVTYDDEEPTADVLAFFRMLAENGIKIGFLSNNHADRVERFNAPLGLPAYPDAHKPLTKTAKQALAGLGVSPAAAASLGDQIFTDLLCARFCGMQALIVPPIRDKRSFFWRFKRAMERPILAAWHKRNGDYTRP